MNNDFDSAGYDTAFVLQIHEEDVRGEIDAEYGPEWSMEKEEAYFVAVFQRMDVIANGMKRREQALDRDSLRPMSLEDRRLNGIRIENARRLRMAALDRKMELKLNPPMNGQPSAVLGGVRLKRVK